MLLVDGIVPSREYTNLKDVNNIDIYDSFLEYPEWENERRSLIELELKEVVKECSKVGWDGYDGEPIKPVTAIEAKRFLNGLPVTILAPCIVPQPDGGIAFEWSNDEGKSFIASLNGKGIIYFSWYHGSPYSGGSGRDILSEDLPLRILENIRSIVGEDY